jgi:hypothetical protein
MNYFLTHIKPRLPEARDFAEMAEQQLYKVLPGAQYSTMWYTSVQLKTDGLCFDNKCC